ncbi:hypothetical protein [Alkalihalobacillus sp. LMS39]|uniref:hypothetical protein n=1 Tax=Alkalihalobacillus sp. LMS39 TaxID=2924032 RepID=UPI001FB2B711|nr:hypothetical protein [Alkalihalobacillus sp. LMS39]UOE93794.1 hypothetical protein MM271_21890 [Alkalihalobacillus sp. LMS39]
MKKVRLALIAFVALTFSVVASPALASDVEPLKGGKIIIEVRDDVQPLGKGGGIIIETTGTVNPMGGGRPDIQ